MRYVYTGVYREFRGYVFAHGNPTTVTDRATLEALEKDPTFRKVEEDPPLPVRPVLRRTLSARR